MKTTTIILLAIGLLSLNSCKQESDPQALLENPETRNEVFAAIADNPDYMTEFMDNMQSEGMQMMMKDSMMVKNMMGNKPMMHSMMNEMMKDGKMMGNMMEMMHEKGMMSEECMESCKNMMGEKGMDMEGMDMKGMDMMDKEKNAGDNHSEHH
ncbi:hypothetical protein [Mariniflexile sp.]|uniref:hypothetical protein n=1 Tax=Mariniflexile sp. TaxID=1979402 RepID=UPI0040481A1A